MELLLDKGLKMNKIWISAVDINMEIDADSIEALEYLYDIIYPSGANGIRFFKDESLTEKRKITMFTLEENEVIRIIDVVLHNGTYIRRCIQQIYGYYEKYSYNDKIYYIYPLYDSSATPNVIIEDGKELILLSTRGLYDYKLLARTVREIAYRRLEDLGYVCIHASAVQLNGKGIIIIGDSAAGKTTIALGLCKFKNAKFITNDKIFVKLDGNKLKTTPFSAAARLNYGTLKTIELEEEYRQWSLKIRIPKDSSDWKEFNGNRKLNILPRELNRILNLEVLGEGTIDFILFPKIKQELKEYTLTMEAEMDVLRRNICTPYDDQFPEDWLGYRHSDEKNLVKNAEEIASYIENSLVAKLEYSFENFHDVFYKLYEITKNLNLTNEEIL